MTTQDATPPAAQGVLDALLAERSEWLIATLIARDFDVPEFHALQVEIARRWKSDRARAEAAERELAEARRERDAARAFVAAMFDESDWPEGGDIDGFAFQELAVKHGLLREETRDKPCAEECWCAQYHCTMAGGVTCYRKAQWLNAIARGSAT